MWIGKNIVKASKKSHVAPPLKNTGPHFNLIVYRNIKSLKHYYNSIDYKRKKTWTHLTLDSTHQIRPANLTINAIKNALDKGQINNMEPTKQHLRFLVRQDQAYNNPQLHQPIRNHKKNKEWHPSTSITTMQPIIQNSTIASISCRPLQMHIPRST